MKCELILYSKIDIDRIRNDLKNDFTDKEGRSFNQYLIYHLIHKYSNYEGIMWALYKKRKSFVMNELNRLLFEISKLDHTLTWDCQIISKRYSKKYSLKNYKSQWVGQSDKYLKFKVVNY